MADAIYPRFKQNLLDGTANTVTTATVRIALVATDAQTGIGSTVNYDADDEFFSNAFNSADSSLADNGQDLTNGVVAIKTLGAITAFANGSINSANITFDTVASFNSGAGYANALVMFTDTGTESTSQLIAWLDDSVTGLGVIPNGTNINLNFNTNGIFQL